MWPQFVLQLLVCFAEHNDSAPTLKYIDFKEENLRESERCKSTCEGMTCWSAPSDSTKLSRLKPMRVCWWKVEATQWWLSSSKQFKSGKLCTILWMYNCDDWPRVAYISYEKLPVNKLQCVFLGASKLVIECGGLTFARILFLHYLYTAHLQLLLRLNKILYLYLSFVWNNEIDWNCKILYGIVIFSSHCLPTSPSFILLLDFTKSTKTQLIFCNQKCPYFYF